MSDYEIRLYIGGFPAARMMVERESAENARKEARRFISQCAEFDWAEVWNAGQKLCTVHHSRPDLMAERDGPAGIVRKPSIGDGDSDEVAWLALA